MNLGSIDKDQMIFPVDIYSPIKNKKVPLVLKLPKGIIENFPKNMKDNKMLTLGGLDGTTQFFSFNKKDLFNDVNRYKNINLTIVQMEDQAVAQVCGTFNVPYIIIRSLSDNIFDKDAEYTEKSSDKASQIAANFSMKYIKEVFN